MVFKDEQTNKWSKSTDILILNYWLIGVAWIFFLAMEAGIGYDRRFSAQPLCPHSERDFGRPEWYVATCFTCLGAFLLMVVNGGIKVLYMAPSKARVIHLAALNINAMGLTSAILSVLFEWGGTCVDTLGVASPGAIWPEWLACGPLLIFITLTVVDKPALAAVDWAMMISFFVCLLAGFLIIVPQSEVMGKFWLFVSVVAYVPTLYLPLYDMGAWMKAAYEAVETDADSELDMADLVLITERFAKQRDLSICLSVVLPIFTVVYFLGLYGYLAPLQVRCA